jgi:hypothetical protein
LKFKESIDTIKLLSITFFLNCPLKLPVTGLKKTNFSSSYPLPSIESVKRLIGVGHWWLMHVSLTTQKAEIKRVAVQSQPWVNSSVKLYLDKTHHKNGLVEWLKV